ncbi:hypothetical protein J4477_03710 [Candidatus Pacearchaeota archaeon]|nr:hypothetical protein [Candidatus Pacearchaeota archaeon]
MDDLKIPFLLPTFQAIPDFKTILPNIYLQPDFRKRVPLFYGQGRKEIIETYVNNINEIIKGTSYDLEVRLMWDDALGLRNIGAGPSAGLDLEDNVMPKFISHNLGVTSGYIAGIIAMQYVAELGKVE